MSGLDIDALRLTEDEAAGLGVPWTLIDTQRRKDLWGIKDWLEGWPNKGPAFRLAQALEQASIERPVATG